MGVLSTATTESAPWGSAIYFYADENFDIYFVTRADTQKYKNITNNPEVALTVADEASQTTVQIAGTITAVPPHDYLEVLFHKLDKIHPRGDETWTPPPNKIHKGNFMPLKLTPSRLQYADYGTYKLDPDASYVETIIG